VGNHRALFIAANWDQARAIREEPMRPWLIGLMGVLLAAPTLASEPQYLDDRSTAVSVIQSFYNAIARKEYARAWSYYEDGQGVASFDAFQKGYMHTATVSIAYGPVSEEGAAGSAYYTVPISLDAVSTSGKHSYFAGCYTLRLANPAIQATPPFRPLHIVSGKLQSAKGFGQKYVPKSCAA
jgi:hypothetical protein